MKIELDTAQFGLTNSSSYDDIKNILVYAQDVGILSINTSPLYGYSEEILGQFDLSNFDVSTRTIKIDYTLSKLDNFENFKDAFYRSQKKLGYIELYSLIFSSADDLLSQQGLALWDLASEFKEKEYIYKLGVNVTKPDQLFQIIDMIDIDIVHFPLNLLDQRFIGILKELKQKHIEVHTHSTFHQGLLLKNKYQIPQYFKNITDVIDSIPEPKAAYALSLPKLLKEVDKITIGCNKINELKTIIDLYMLSLDNIDYDKFRINDESYLLPELFNKFCKNM